MNFHKCEKCKQSFQIKSNKTVVKCTRCGSLVKNSVSSNPAIKTPEMPLPNQKKAVQNFKCRDCMHEFRIVLNQKGSGLFCIRCKSQNIQSMSPVAFVHEPRKMTKEMQKFVKYQEFWINNSSDLQKACDNIVFYSRKMGLDESLLDELLFVAEKVKKESAKVRDEKFSIFGRGIIE